MTEAEWSRSASGVAGGELVDVVAVDWCKILSRTFHDEFYNQTTETMI